MASPVRSERLIIGDLLEWRLRWIQELATKPVSMARRTRLEAEGLVHLDRLARCGEPVLARQPSEVASELSRWLEAYEAGDGTPESLLSWARNVMRAASALLPKMAVVRDQRQQSSPFRWSVRPHRGSVPRRPRGDD